MSELKMFDSAEFGSVRVMERDGEPWFVGKDVAASLGYSNASKAIIAHVDDDDKRFEMMLVSDSQNGNLVKTALINESGLYSLVLSSKLPSAKKFKRWVTGEVIPSIRKHGAYMNKETLEKALLSPEYLMKVAKALKEERDRRIALQKKVEQDKHKVEFYDCVGDTETGILVRDMAKILQQAGVHVGEHALFEWLRRNDYIVKQRGLGRNMPKKWVVDRGLMRIRESVHMENGKKITSKAPVFTGKGQEHIFSLMTRKD